VRTPLLALALLAALVAPPHAAQARGVEPQLSAMSLTYPAIHAVGVRGTHFPRKTHLLLTLNVPALVRVRVKDTNPYGLSRAFNVDLPAGPSTIGITARVDGTKLPPGRYRVIFKAHNADGSSDKFRLKLRIVGKDG
jgi:hypothetical protein